MVVSAGVFGSNGRDELHSLKLVVARVVGGAECVTYFVGGASSSERSAVFSSNDVLRARSLAAIESASSLGANEILREILIVGPVT